MMTPLFLLTISLIGCVAAIAYPPMSDALLIFAPMLIASIWLVIKSARRSPEGSEHLDETPRDQDTFVIIDGSNVMYWRTETPEWPPLMRVIMEIKRAGFTPGVMIDANAGYKLDGKYMHDREFSQRLGVPMDRIMVVPKGTPADGYILQAARDYGARIVTNDKFRDWADQYPEVKSGNLMIPGHYDGDRLVLSL